MKDLKVSNLVLFITLLLLLIACWQQTFSIPENWQKGSKKFISARIEQVRIRKPGELSLLVQTSKGKILLNLPQIFDLQRCRVGNDVIALVKLYPLTPGFADFKALYDYTLLRRKVIARAWVVDEFKCIGIEIEAPLRLKIFEILQKRFGDSDELSLILAMNLGAGEILSESLRELFRDLGLSHVLVVSGFHIGLVFVISFALFDYIISRSVFLLNYIPSEYLSFPLSFIVSTIFCFVSGAQIPCFRALIFLLLSKISKLIGSQSGSLHRLLFTLCILLLFDTTSLFDLSLLLSFFAVLGVIVGMQVRSYKFITTSIFAWLYTLPLCLLFFGQLVVFSPIINIILLPLITVIFSFLGLFAIFIGLLNYKQLFSGCLWLLELTVELIWKIHEYFHLYVLNLSFDFAYILAFVLTIFNSLIFVYFYKFKSQKNDDFEKLAKA